MDTTKQYLGWHKDLRILTGTSFNDEGGPYSWEKHDLRRGPVEFYRPAVQYKSMQHSGRPSIFKRRFMVDAKLQWGLIGQAFIIAGGVSFVFYMLQLYTVSEFIKDPNLVCTDQEQLTWVYTSKLKGRMDMVFILQMLALLVVLGIWLVAATHRIIGPLFRMSRYLDQIASNHEPGELKFRDKDYPHALARSINQVTKFYEDKLQRNSKDDED